MSSELKSSRPKMAERKKEKSDSELTNTDFTAPKRWKLVLVLYLAGIGSPRYGHRKSGSYRYSKRIRH